MRPCRTCGTERSPRAWIVLFVTIASFIFFWLNPPIELGIVLGLIILTYFGVVIVIDIEHRLILHPTSIFGAVLGLITGTYLYTKIGDLQSGFITSILGGVAGFAIMFILYQIGTLVAKIRARKLTSAGQGDDGEEALGGGDVYLAGVLGLMLGWPNIIVGLVYGIILGGAISILTLVRLFLSRRYSETSLMTFIPYGPSLVLGVFYVLYFLLDLS